MFRILKLLFLILSQVYLADAQKTEWTKCRTFTETDCGTQYKYWPNVKDRKIGTRCKNALRKYKKQKSQRAMLKAEDACPRAVQWRACMTETWSHREETDYWYLIDRHKYAKGTLGFYKAQASCVEYGAQLTSINSKQELDWLRGLINTFTNYKYVCVQIGLIRMHGNYQNWTGTVDEAEDQMATAWRWLDGTPITDWKLFWHQRNNKTLAKPENKARWEPNDGYDTGEQVDFESEVCMRLDHLDKPADPIFGELYDMNTNWTTGTSGGLPFICKKECKLGYNHGDRKNH